MKIWRGGSRVERGEDSGGEDTCTIIVEVKENGNESRERLQEDEQGGRRGKL